MLEYDPDPNVHHITVNKTRVKNSYWSKLFCQSLETLLVHPFWDRDFATMIIFIQYAVICRTNDQRGSQWPRKNLMCDLLFETFRQYTANIHHDMESVVDLHRRALRRLGNVPSRASKLLLAIEAAAFDAVTEPFLPSESTAPQKVCTKDLQAVLTALQNLTTNGVPIYLAPSTYLDMISKAIRKSQTSPSDTKLEGNRERVLLDMRRTEIKNDNVLRINRNMQDPANELLMPGAAATYLRPSPQPMLTPRSRSLVLTTAANTAAPDSLQSQILSPQSGAVASSQGMTKGRRADSAKSEMSTEVPILGLDQSNPPPFGERPVMDIPNLPEFACERGFQDPARRFKFQSIKFTRFAPSMLFHHAALETAGTHGLLDPKHSGLEVPKVYSVFINRTN